MTKQQFLEEETGRLTEALTHLAQTQGLLEEDEKVVVSIRFTESVDPLSLTPEEFFSIERLLAAGAPSRIAVRVNTAFHWARHGEAMEVFLVKHRDVSKLFRFKNIGRTCVAYMVRAMKNAGITVTDVRNMLK